MKSLPQIVSPPLWYALFWTVVFLPCFGVTVYFAVKWGVLAALRAFTEAPMK
jgi:hypothetical protein